jgi:predicted permease
MAIADSVGMDLRYSVRGLLKSPGFTITVALSLALGIGANTAIFSLMDAVMWRLLPVRAPAGLLMIDPGLTYEQFRTLQNDNTVAGIAAYSAARLNVSVNGSIEPTADGQLVTGDFFPLLGVSALLGRTIGPDDDRLPNGQPVAMISAGYWKRRFAADPGIVGRTIAISGLPHTIIGVTPPEFFGVDVGSNPDLFVPVMMQPTVVPALENLLDQPIIYRTWLTALVRLKPGVPLPQATTALQTLWLQHVPQGLRGGKGPGLDQRLGLVPASTGLSSLRRQFSQPLLVLTAIVAIVLLIACANTANLLLARAAARSLEIAMRLALGAGRWRITRQLLVESVVLGLLGGVCGVLFAYWATRFLVVYMSSGRSPVVLDLTPNLRTLGFTATVSMATGLVFGLVPAMRATRIYLSRALKRSGSLVTRGGGLGPGKVIAVAQVALSLLLLVGAGMFVRSVQRLLGDDFGVSRDSVLVMRVEPKGNDQRNIPGMTARLDQTYRDLVARVSAIPGVRVPSMGQTTPTRVAGGAGMSVELPSGELVRVSMVMLYADYFRTIGVPIVKGREFRAEDLVDGAPAACIVNEAFARQVFPGEDPIGKTCFTGRRPNVHDTAGPRYGTAPEAYRIVGVVKDARYTNPRGQIDPIIYLTFLQTPTGRGQMVLHVRVGGDARTVQTAVRDQVLRVDPTLPTFEIHTLAEEMEAALVQERLIAMLSTFFGGLALVLAAVGLYGLLAFGVVQRTGEIGVRLALGARSGAVVWMILRDALISSWPVRSLAYPSRSGSPGLLAAGLPACCSAFRRPIRSICSSPSGC